MFSSLINSAKNAVAGLAETAESGSSAAPEAPPPQQQPTASAPSEKPKEGGDFFSGLLDVAKEVGKTIGENTEKGAESVKEGANATADSTKNTAEGAAQMTKEDLEKLKQGIGALVGQASEAYHKYSSKSEENIEEEVSCVDSKGGKVQLPSVVEKEKMTEQNITKEEEKGSDFFSGLLNAAKEVGKTIGESTEKGAESVKEGAGAAAESTKNTAEGAAQMTKEDLEKLKQGIGALVGQASQAYQKYSAKTEENVEEQVSCVDSEGGKVQLPSVLEQEKAISKTATPEEGKGSDFFSGLLNAAKEVGKTIGESTEKGVESVKEGAGAAATGTKNTAEGAAQMTKEDLDKITQGLGSLVGKATEAYHNFSSGDKKPTDTKEEDKQKEATQDFDKISHPVVDDIEGEIPMVVTGGYTGQVEKKDSGLFDAISRTTKEGAGWVVDGAKSAGSATMDAGQTVVDATKEGLNTAADKTKEGTGWVVDGAKSAGSATMDAGQTVVDATKEGLDTAADKTKEGAGWVVDGAKSAGSATTDASKTVVDATTEGLNTAADKTKEGAGWVVDGAKSAGSATMNAGETVVDATTEGLNTAADKTKEGAGLVVDGAKSAGSATMDAGQTVVDATKEGLNTAADKTKEGAGWVVDGAKSAGSATMDAGQTVVDATKEGLNTAADKTKEGAGWVVDGAKSAGSATMDAGQTVVDATKEGLNTAADKTKEGAGWVVDGAKSAGSATMDAGQTVVDATKEGLNTAADKTKEGAGWVVDGAKSAGSSGLKLVTGIFSPKKTTEGCPEAEVQEGPICNSLDMEVTLHSKNSSEGTVVQCNPQQDSV